MKPLKSTVSSNTYLNCCQSLPSPSSIYPEGAGEYYNAGRLIFKSTKLKGFSNFCLIRIVKFKFFFYNIGDAIQILKPVIVLLELSTWKL